MPHEQLLNRDRCNLPKDPDSIGFLFHVITITITCTSIFALVELAISQPTPVEKELILKPYTPDKVREVHGVSSIVRTGFFIKNFREFDLIANTFVLEGEIWFQFDPSSISLETISHFSFEKGEIKYLSAPRTQLVGNSIVARYDIVLKFSSSLNYAFFPIDDHILSLVLLNKKVSPHEIVFESDNQEFIIEARTESYGWNLYYHKVYSGYIEENFDSRDTLSRAEYPALQFSFYYIRSGFKYALILLLPMLVFIIVMLTAFSYDPEKYFSSIMVANGASLSGLIGFRFVIENMAPKVGYFMLSDYFFIIFLSIAALLFLIGIFSAQLTIKVKRLLLLLIHALIIALFTIIVLHVLSYSFYISDIVS